MKKILEACIEQILQFDSEMEWIAFHHNLKTGRKAYEVLSEEKQIDGSVIVHIKKQYNNNKFSERSVS